MLHCYLYESVAHVTRLENGFDRGLGPLKTNYKYQYDRV